MQGEHPLWFDTRAYTPWPPLILQFMTWCVRLRGNKAVLGGLIVDGIWEVKHHRIVSSYNYT